MRALMLDTNVLISLFKGDGKVSDVISAYDKILIPSIVLGEFKAGVVLDARNGDAQRAVLDSLLDSPSVEVVPVSEQTTDSYALLFKALKERGTPIPQNDLWIATLAMERAVPLFSLDRHFEIVPLLRLVRL